MITYPNQKINTEEMLAAYAREETLEEIAERFGVTRAAVSLALIKLGIHPNERRLARAEERRARRARARVRARVEMLARTEARVAAQDRLRSLARELGVSPNTLGQYAAKTGPYAVVRTPRIDAILPPRYSPEGEALARHVFEICEPYSPHYLGNSA